MKLVTTYSSDIFINLNSW